MKRYPFIQRFIKYILIPFVLLFIWLVLSVFFNSYGPLSVLTYPNGTSETITLIGKPLYKNSTATGTFTAIQNNLGIVSVRFTTYDRINSDKLLFKIKEIGASNWYYQNSYKVDQFQPEGLFTFGFPIIVNSKNKSYIFTLTSLDGKRGDSVAVSKKNPVFVTKYQYSKHEILANKRVLFAFMINKLLNSVATFDFKVSSFVYLLPFLLYVLSFFKINDSFRFLMQFFIVFLVILVVIFFAVILTSPFADIIILGSWLWVIVRYQYNSSVTFMCAVLFLLFIPFLLTVQQEEIARGAIYWSYYFFVIGTFQWFLETKDIKDKKDYISLFKNINKL